jgi:hypothetical protein
MYSHNTNKKLLQIYGIIKILKTKKLSQKPEVVKLGDMVGVGCPVVDNTMVLPVPQLLQEVHVQVHLLK